MNHPFFSSRKLIFIYAATWIVVSAIHVFILQSLYLISIQSAIVDSIFFNFSFALLGLAIWYVVAYSKPVKTSVINQLINHITSLAIILVIWIAGADAILKAVITEPAYKTFLEGSTAWRVVSGVFFYSIIVLIYYIIIYYNDLQERSAREAKLNDIVKQAALDSLRSQINPHFLFNSLNSISSLTMTDPGKAQEMIIKLSDFLRYSIKQSDNNFSTLQTELDNIKRYLDIEEIRFGAKLIKEYDVADNCLAHEVPAMIMQPLYENAVKHGVYESTEPIRIFTSCKMDDNFLQIIISNNFDPQAISRKGAGIGLKNIKERLQLIYGSARLLKTRIENNVFVAELTIPGKNRTLINNGTLIPKLRD
jgi:two-component system, LytTR family, sensor kinase